MPSTGSLRGDLLAALDQIACSATDVDAAIIAGVMSAMRTDPELAELVRTQIIDSKKGEFNGIIERAIRRGELPQGGSAELVEEVISALLINRLVIHGLPIDEEFVDPCGGRRRPATAAPVVPLRSPPPVTPTRGAPMTTVTEFDASPAPSTRLRIRGPIPSAGWPWASSPWPS